MKTLWESHTFTKASVVPGWLPTWTALKEVMVNALGTSAERRDAGVFYVAAGLSVVSLFSLAMGLFCL
jgi:hypothetical protein